MKFFYAGKINKKIKQNLVARLDKTKILNTSKINDSMKQLTKFLNSTRKNAYRDTKKSTLQKFCYAMVMLVKS